MSDHFGNISIAPSPSVKPVPRPEKQHTRRRQEKKKSPEKKRISKKSHSHAPARKNRALLYLFVLLILLPCLYCLGGFWLVPLYMGKALPARFAERTGMHLSIQGIEFNPFSFRLSLQGLTLRPSQATSGAPDIMTAAKIVADLAPLSLLRNDLVSNSLNIEGLELTIIRTQDNHYNIEDFFRVKTATPTSDIMSFSELPFLFSLNNISIRKSKATFQDTPTAATHILEQIELDLPSLSNFPFQADDYIRPRFSAVMNGSKIELTGQAALPSGAGKSNLETKLTCNIQALELPLYFKYVPTSLPMVLSQGKADGKLQLSFTRGTKDERAKISIHFAGQIADMEIADRNKPLTAVIPQTSLEGSYSPISRDLHINKLLFQKPHITSRSALDFSTFSLAFPKKTSTAKDATKEKLSPAVDINLLRIEDGSLDIFADENQKKPQATWNALQLSINDFSSDLTTETPAKNTGSFNVRGEKPETGTAFSWQGRFNEQLSPEGQFSLDNLAAKTFFTLLGISGETVQSGTANLQGRLALKARNSQDATPTADISETEITLQGLKLLADKEPWLDAPTIKLSGFSRKNSRIDLGNLRLENGSVNLHTEKFPEIFKEMTTKEGRLSLNALDFNGKIIITSKTQKPVNLTEVLLQAKSLKDANKSNESLILSAKINDTGRVKAKGSAQLTPFNLSLNAGFSGVEAKMLFPWFSSLPLLTEAQATIGGKGILNLPEGSFSGELRLDNAVFNQNGKPLLSWKSCDLQDLNYTRSPFHLGIVLMDIDHPVMGWQRASKEKHPAAQFGAAIRELLPTADTPSPQGKKSIEISQLDIQEIKLKNGEINYTDTRLSPPWPAAIRNLNGQITALHSHAAKENSSFSLSGTINESPFSLLGTADFFSKIQSGQATFKASDFPLAAFTPYLPANLGIDASKGVVAVNNASSWKDSQVSGKIQLLFNSVETTSPEAEAALPLALLKNEEGRIALNVNPAHNLAEESVPVVLDTLTTLQRQVLKAKVSPLLLATGDFTDLVGNEYADFQPGGFILTENGKKILSRFSTFLDSHPYIGIRITGCADRKIDGDSLKKQLEEIEAKRVDQENQRRKAAWQKERDLNLERQKSRTPSNGQSTATQSFSSPEELPAYTPITPVPIVIEDSMLEDLAKERAVRVQALLTGKLSLDPARIIISQDLLLTSDTSTPGNRAQIDLNVFSPTEKKPAIEPPSGQ